MKAHQRKKESDSLEFFLSDNYLVLLKNNSLKSGAKMIYGIPEAKCAQFSLFVCSQRIESSTLVDNLEPELGELKSRFSKKFIKYKLL